MVNEQTGEPVPYATIRIGKLPKYVDIIKVSATDDQGYFEVEMPPSIYILSISFIGYETIPIIRAQIAQKGDIADLGKIKMKESPIEMNEVLVKPLVQISSSEIVYNLDQDPDRETSTLYDLIDRVPMVNLTPDGKIYIGDPENSFLIVRNGKKDVLFNNGEMRESTLKSIPAKAFASIKIKLIPEQRYGNYKYVMSIETDKTNSLLGVINQNYDKYDMAQGQLNLLSALLGSYDKLRFNLSGAFANTRSPKSKTYLEQHFFSEHSLLQQREESHQSGESVSPVLAFSYDLAKHHFITGNIQYTYSRNRDKKTFQNVQTLDDTETRYSQYTYSQNRDRGINGELDYQYDFEKPNRVLNIVYNFSHAPTENRNDVYTDGDVEFVTPILNGKALSNQHALQMHYADPLLSTIGMETGLSYLYRTYQTFSDYSANGTPLPENKYDMKSSKQLFTYYINLRYTSKKFSASLNLETEYLYDGKGTEITYGEKAPEYISETGFLITPNLSTSFNLGRNKWINSLSVSYRWLKQRPNIRMMTTNTDYSNPNYLYVGNPALDPQNTHMVSVNLQNLKSRITLTATGSITDKQISKYWYNDESGRIVNTYTNAGNGRGFSSVIRYHLYMGKTNLAFALQETYSYREVNGLRSENSRSSINTQTGIPLFKIMTLQTLFSYTYEHNSGMEKGRMLSPFYWQLSANFQLFKKRLEVEAISANILRFKNKVKQEVYMPDFTQYQDIRVSSIPFEIKLTWHLGSFKVKPIKKANRGAVINDVLTGD